MPPTLKLKLALISLFFFIFSGHVQASDGVPGAGDLAREVYHYHIGDNSVAMMSMELVDKNNRSRIRRLVNITMDDHGRRSTMIRFLEPADIAGTGFLSIEQDGGGTEQFLYLPALDRTRRIVATQKGRSFVNTDFTYEDMQRRPVEESQFTIAGQESIADHDCWILEERPLPVSDSQYSLIRSWIPKNIALPVRIHFFDKNNKHVKEYVVEELEEIQGIHTPLRVMMVSYHDGHKTILTIEAIEYNSQQVNASLFTTRYLENW